MEIGIPWYLDTPLGTISFVQDGDGIHVREVANMDGAQIRANSEPLPAADGAYIYPSYRGARFPILGGVLKATEGPYGVAFNGTSQYTTTTDTASLRPETTDKFSWAGWVKVNSLTPATPNIWDKGGHTLKIVGGGSGALRLQVTTTAAVLHDWTTNTLPLVAGEWTHVAVTFDNHTALPAFYVNGVAAGFTKTTGGTFTVDTGLQDSSAYAFTHAREAGASSNYLAGSLRGPLLFYNRALAATEPASLYQGSEPSTTGLVFRYDVDEGTGAVWAQEASGGVANANLVNTPAWSRDTSTTLMLARRRQLEDRLRAYTDSLTRADGTLRFVPSGATERQLTVRLMDAIDIQGVGPLKTWQVSFQAGDPLIYATAEQQADTGTVGAPSGSETFPYGFPVGYGVTSSAAPAVVVNGGTAPTWPRFLIYGPAVSPNVQLAETGESFVLMGLTIDAGDYAEVKVRENTITLNGDPDLSLLSYLDAASARLPMLGVGTNTVNFYGGTVASAAKVRVYWRDGYV